ncbi:alpha/beta-hydrolase [Auriculariales sp. MPI-PUGE-AT-0066]|nr:alpha/beta-hydrolase [Auriculariales sp. MPI-PUGE-AT-0066]
MTSFLERYASQYRDATTSRGFKYHFLAIEPAAGQPTLLFLHGFPSHSFDWHYQVDYFHSKGYGLVVPDMLGYGGTDKPTDPALFKYKLLSQDMIDVLDSISWIKDAKVIAVAHDWGAAFNSRLMLYYSDRFIAFVSICVGGVRISNGPIEFDTLLPLLKQATGYELLAYQEFFTKAPDAAQVMENNIESLLDLMTPADASAWLTYLCVRGATEEYMRGGKRIPRASFMSDEFAAAIKDSFQRNGLSAPLCWYKVFIEGHNTEDDATLQGKTVDKPVLYVGATRDYVCPPAVHKAILGSFASNLSTTEFDTGHWVFMEKPDQFNQELEAFVQKVTKAN